MHTCFKRGFRYLAQLLGHRKQSCKYPEGILENAVSAPTPKQLRRVVETCPPVVSEGGPAETKSGAGSLSPQAGPSPQVTRLGCHLCPERGDAGLQHLRRAGDRLGLTPRSPPCPVAAALHCVPRGTQSSERGRSSWLFLSLPRTCCHCPLLHGGTVKEDSRRFSHVPAVAQLESGGLRTTSASPRRDGSFPCPTWFQNGL